MMMEDDAPQQPAAPVQYAPPSPSQQYTEVLDWNINNAPKVLESRQQYDSQFGELDAQAKALSAERGMQSFTDLYAKYGDKLATANKDFALSADPLGQQRYDFILDELGKNDTGVSDRLKGLYDSQFQDRSLTDALKGEALQGLSLGTKLDPQFEASLTDRLRTIESARGQNYSPAATFRELLSQGEAGQAMKQQRVGNALNITSALQSADKFDLEGKLNILRQMGTENLQGTSTKATFLGLTAPPRLGETTGAFSAGYSPTASNSPFNTFADIGSTSKIYGDISNFGSNMFNTQAQMYGVDKSTHKDTMDMIGQGTDIAGSFMSMAGMGMMMCWVAEELYGKNNPKVSRIRNFCLRHAGEQSFLGKFVSEYQRFGLEWAENIRVDKVARAVAQNIWDHLDQVSLQELGV